jgi:hypothetical protein
MGAEIPETDLLITDLLGFPPPSSKYWESSQTPSFYFMILIQPSRFRLIKIKLFRMEETKLSIQITQFAVNSENKIPLSFSQGTTSNYSNVFAFIIPLSEWRAGQDSNFCKKNPCSPPASTKLSVAWFSHFSTFCGHCFIFLHIIKAELFSCTVAFRTRLLLTLQVRQPVSSSRSVHSLRMRYYRL